MPIIGKDWWSARLAGSKITGRNFDVTCTLTKAQKDADTCRLWAAIRAAIGGTKSILDYGCGLARFAPHAKATGMRYVGADILPDLASDCATVGVPFVLLDGASISPDLDCDAAIYCNVIQHLDDAEARHAFNSTRAKILIVIDGASKSDSYTIAREFPAYVSLLEDCGCSKNEKSTVTTPLVTYKMVVGIRP